MATIIMPLVSIGGAAVLNVDQRHQNYHNSNIWIKTTKQIAIPMQIKVVPYMATMSMTKKVLGIASLL